MVYRNCGSGCALSVHCLQQVQLVQASLASAHELVQSLRYDVSEHVKKEDVEKALVAAMKLASSVRLCCCQLAGS